eukprot:Sdes_comp19473_c0_seq1m10922
MHEEKISLFDHHLWEPDRPKDGIEAVKYIFQDVFTKVDRQNFNPDLSPEVSFISNSIIISLCAGFFGGGMLGSKRESRAHVIRNQNTIYSSKLHSQKEMNHAVIRGFFFGGSSMALKLGCLCGYLTISGVVAKAYRGKDDILNSLVPSSLLGGILLCRGEFHSVCLLFFPLKAPSCSS